MSESYRLNCVLKAYYDSLIENKVEENKVEKIKKDDNYIFVLVNGVIYKKKIKYE